MSNAKKLFAIAVTALTVLGMVGFVPSGAKAAVAGNLIKMAGNSAVYYFDGTKRFVFPQENVYKSWYKDFSGVMTVSQSELQSYPIGGNVTMRAGSWMVKITTDPKVYAVTPGGVLHHVDTEARALALWGANWNKMIVDVSDAFFVNYTTGTALSSNVHPDGSLLKVGTQYYYVMAGVKRPFASDAALAANMMNTAFAVETSISYTDGSSITGAEVAITNVAGSASSTPTSAAGLTVSGGAMTAATSLPKGGTSVKVGEWNFAAGPEGAVMLNNLMVKRTGVGAVGDISNAYIYDGANRLTSGKTFNSSTNEATFTLNVSVPAGSTKILGLFISVATTAASGDEHVFGIESAAKVTSNAASVNGVFPINSNKHSIAGASAGTITIENSGSLSNPRVGDRGVKISEFKLSASTEDAWVSQISLTQGGNLATSAMSNFMLKQNSVLVASASAIASNDRLDLVFSPAFYIERGNNRIFELYFDVDGRPADTISFYMDDVVDLRANGGTFGVGMTPSINANFDGAADQQVTLQGGAFTISWNGPSSANISNSASDVVIWDGTIYSANTVEVRNWRFGIQDLTAAGEGLCESASSCHVQDVKLWNLTNNTVIAGPFEFTAAANLGEASPSYFTFTDDVTINAGSTTRIGLSVDIRNTPANTVVSLQARMGNATNSFTANDIKNTGSNTYLTLGTDITPSGEILGQTQTVVAGALTITTAPSPTDHITVKGTANETMTGFNFAAGSGSSVKVTSIQVTAGMSDTDDNGYGAAGASNSDGSASSSVANLVLTAKLMDGTTQIGLSKSFVSGVATFDSLAWTIPASQTKGLNVVITTNSGATLSTTSDFMRLSLEASSVTAVDSNGNSVSAAGSLPVNSTEVSATDVVVQVKSTGSLTATIAPTPTNPTAALVASGSMDKVLAAYKFEAIDESFLVKKLTLISSNSANNGRLSSLKVRYPSQSSGTQTQVVGLSGTNNAVDISLIPMYVAQNGSATLEVLGDAAVFTNLDGNEGNVTLGFTLDSDGGSGTNQATGLGSNQDVTNWGSDAAGNAHLFVRTILTAAAGSGTPNNTSRTRSAGQKVFSANLSAGSSSNAFLRGSRKAPDSAITGWAATDADSLAATIATAGNFVSGASAITSVSAATTASVLAHDFGVTPTLNTYQRVSAWVRLTNSSGGGAAVTFDVDDTALLASPQGTVAVGTSSTTPTWYYVDVTTASLGVTTATQYVGLKAPATGAGTQTMVIDDLRFYRDSVNLDVAGSLGLAATVQGLLFQAKDTSGTVRAYGAYNGTAAAGTVVLIAGTGSDVAVITNYSDVEVSSSTLALDVETNTTTLMFIETVEVTSSLSVSVDTGTTTSAGDFLWYDNSDSAGGNNVAAISAVNPTSSTITFANTY